MSESNETSAAAPMRLRAEPPRVTRLSRKVLASLGVFAGLGIGGALIYALQTRTSGDDGKELYSTTNRQPADGLAGLPRDYTGPVLGPPLPGDLGRPILDAQNKGQPVVPPTIATPTVDEAEQRRRAEEGAFDEFDGDAVMACSKALKHLAQQRKGYADANRQLAVLATLQGLGALERACEMIETQHRFLKEAIAR